MPRPSVDIVVLSRDASPLPEAVTRGIELQTEVDARLHRVIGAPRPTDRNRWETIARARNEGRSRGHAPWLVFVDDDVVLAPRTFARLIQFLESHPIYGAAAADYQDHAATADTHHVTMGATLFRRAALAQITFRWEAGKCECRCCCNDLRDRGWGIRYVPGVVARHGCEPTAEPTHSEMDPARRPASDEPVSQRGHVLAAFDRRHRVKFRQQFLETLRRHGNQDLVHVIGYGLYPSEANTLRQLSGVEVTALPDDRVLPPIRRLQDFQSVVRRLPADALVAYWDAADVFFQGSLQPLWKTVRANPDRLLAVREPRGYPGNPAVWSWSLSIRHPLHRARALELLKANPFLNSGFAAGTAASMLAYFAEAHRLRHSDELLGSRDWGDQMALNLYCHSHSSRWLEVEQGWNFCVHDRGRAAVRIRNGVVEYRDLPIHVVHGNAHSVRHFELTS